MEKENIYKPLISFFEELKQQIDAQGAIIILLSEKVALLEKQKQPIFFDRRAAAEYIGCKDRYFQKEYVPNIPNYGTQRKQKFCKQEIDAYILSKGK